MGLFKKKPKAEEPPVDSPDGLQDEVEEEVLSPERGMAIDEIERLLELLGRDAPKRRVSRRRVGCVPTFWKRAHWTTLDKALAGIHEKVEKLQEQRESKPPKTQPVDGESEKLPLLPGEIPYPLKLSPDDVLNATNAVRQALEQSLPQREKETPEERQAKRIFEALEQLKNEEATQFARYIANVQNRQIIDQMKEGETDDMWKKYGLDDEELERIRTMQGFGKRPLKTLLDEAGSVVDEDAGAAARVLQQWIGSVKQENE